MKKHDMMKKTAFVSIALILLALNGCSGVKRDLGLVQDVPDEFTVIKRAPLSMPPDYSLPPPTPGARDRTEIDVTAEAQKKILGTDSPQSVEGVDGAFLSKVGADAADPDIRATIDRERVVERSENDRPLDKVIFWKDGVNPESSSVVDPKAESERLRENQQAGKPVNDGDVPVIEKKPSTIDKLF